jgi:hypothetical protein
LDSDLLNLEGSPKIENEELDVLSGGIKASPEAWEVFRDV